MKISICIPTYNREHELKILLESISLSISNIPNKAQAAVEVIVSDNASTDGTETAIVNAQKRYPWLRYTRNEHNEGFAKNLNQAVQLSTAEYVWLMGSDDILLPNAITDVLRQLYGSPSVLIGNPITKNRERRFFLFEGQQLKKFTEPFDLSLYISQCREISAIFAFMSCLIIKRDFWENVNCPHYELAHAYTHKLRIIRGLTTNGGTVNCINNPLVITGDAGNEWNRTVLPHFELDLMTIKYEIETFAKDCPNTLHAYGCVFKAQYSTIETLKARIQCKRQRWIQMSGMLEKLGYPKFLLKKRSYDWALFIIYIAIKKFRKLLSY